MREVLFRGKTEQGKWLYGYFVKGNYNTGFGIIEDHIDTGLQYVKEETVGQYTGLTANGKKIFEGDIGIYKNTDGAKIGGKPIICTGKVIYNEKTLSYAVNGKDDMGCKYFDYFPIKDFEVIGNIHDNPELLEKTNEK